MKQTKAQVEENLTHHHPNSPHQHHRASDRCQQETLEPETTHVGWPPLPCFSKPDWGLSNPSSQLNFTKKTTTDIHKQSHLDLDEDKDKNIFKNKAFELMDCLSKIIGEVPDMDAPEVYWSSGCPFSRKVIIALLEKKVKYNSRSVCISLGDHTTPSFCEMNPRKMVPIFKFRGVCHTESNAILLYINDLYPDPPLLPQDPTQKALCITRMLEAEHISRCITNFKPYFWGRKQKEDNMTEYCSLYSILIQELKRWDVMLENKDYLMGEQFTLADICLGSYLSLLHRFGMDLSVGTGFENLSRYLDVLRERESMIDSYPPHWGESPDKEIISFNQNLIDFCSQCNNK